MRPGFAILVGVRERIKVPILLRFPRKAARKFFPSDSRKMANRVQVLRFGLREFTVRLLSHSRTKREAEALAGMVFFLRTGAVPCVR